MENKDIVKIATVWMYIMWVGLLISIFIDGLAFLKLGIVVGSIASYAILEKLKKEDCSELAKSKN